ncbi:MAG: hypothetical protein IJC89_03285 [Clostridia bacterium]|nr:hypothetical protein [Clostridia bacterium]
MQILLWILAFIGVALIYVVPSLGGKFGINDNISTILKIAGVLLAIVSLLALYKTGGFN